MSFPQLLRRSAFAQHDPLITRIYTSTPSSIHQHGDWGLKYPIHRQKKYIKVSNLDAGAAVGADWRSGEREARFVETWGTGKVRWLRDQDPTLRKQRSVYSEVMADGDAPVEQYRLVPDLEAMTPAEFERHLDDIRVKRKEFLEHQLTSKDTVGWQKDDKTLANLAASGHSTELDGDNMQASVVKAELSRSQSRTLHPHPHPTGGLYYSQHLPSPSNELSYIDPRTTIPGRALNKKDRDQHRQDASSRVSPADNNLPLVVSVGGVTAGVKPYNAGESIEETDYTRTSPERGVGRFQVRLAKLHSLPTVLNLRAGDVASRYGSRSNAKRATPLDTCNFHIELDLANPSALGQGRREMEPGSSEWVRRDKGRTVKETREDGLGGQKTARAKGAAVAAIKAADKEARNWQAGRFGQMQQLLANRPSTLRQR